MSAVSSNADTAITRAAVMSRDHDIGKGAIEVGCVSTTTNAPGLDADGLPDDETAIASHALGARIDGSQG